MTPISPREVIAAKQKALPPEVFAAFDELIVKHYRDGEAKIAQEDVVNLICTKLDIFRAEVIEKKYLDVEAIYRAAGWTVYYDKPAYCESYGATFTFKGGV